MVIHQLVAKVGEIESRLQPAPSQRPAEIDAHESAQMPACTARRCRRICSCAPSKPTSSVDIAAAECPAAQPPLDGFSHHPPARISPPVPPPRLPSASDAAVSSSSETRKRAGVAPLGRAGGRWPHGLGKVLERVHEIVALQPASECAPSPRRLRHKVPPNRSAFARRRDRRPGGDVERFDHPLRCDYPHAFDKFFDAAVAQRVLAARAGGDPAAQR